ncbi:MAG: phosphoribosylglycinamide formyltransferase [Planctomycetes bacterium]|nr:phosphoribosylglycinamide formyltransferase [Planctomycetota bacterium]
MSNLVILASGSGRTLVNIHQRICDGYLDASISLVIISRADVKAVQHCQQLKLPYLIIGPASHPDAELRNKLILGAIFEARADLVVLAGWLQLLPIPAELENKVLNIHPALLPDFGGKGYYGNHVHQAVKDSGSLISGCTVHYASDEYDRGEIILQTAVQLEKDFGVKQIAEAVFKAELITYPQAIKLVLSRDN